MAIGLGLTTLAASTRIHGTAQGWPIAITVLGFLVFLLPAVWVMSWDKPDNDMDKDKDKDNQ